MGNCFCTATDRPVVRVSHITSTKSISPGDNGSQLENEHVKRVITKEDVIRNGNKERVESYDEESKNDDERSGKIITPNLKMFTLSELKKATRDFRPDTILGEGGFGRVFKGWIDENTFSPCKVGTGMPVAVKKSNPDSSQGLKEWQAEVKFLGKFSHPNLVKLIGYCWEEDQYLLVYEHIQKGSLENHLFRSAEPLSWKTRLEIAIGAARGLAFLHNYEKSVIYRDFKAANILLDNAYNAKLSDFGLAKFGPVNGQSHVTTQVIGTYGYAAPEYIATGHLYVKSDVYGFGVVLLELLTGLRALDPNRPHGMHNLVDWAKPSLSKKKKLKKIMDPAIGDQCPIKGAMKSSELIIKCLESDPKSRPSMDEVLQTLENIKAIKETTKETKKCNDKRHEKHSLSNVRSPIHRKISGMNPTS